MLAPIPTELITLLGSSLIGGIMKLWARSQDARRQEHLLAIHALNARAQIVDQARRYENAGFQWTRRLIAIIATIFIIALPKIIPLFHPDIPVHIGYPEIDEGFLFFSSDIEKTNWIELRGIVLTPLDTHLLSAIIGLYFGGSLASHR